MKLGFFTMPIHPLDKDWRQSLREDREAFVLADELGFAEGYAGEHVTDQAENITSCLMFLASLIDRTKTIKLGTGTVNMPNSHPATIAAQVAMLDHMLDGRFIFGISPGGLLSDAEVFGNLDADRNAMFLEAINQVLQIWQSDPPYNLKGKYWNIGVEKHYLRDIGQGFIPKPLQRPHPPIVVTAVAPFSKGVTEAAARGWDPISANFLMPAWVKSHWPKYVEGCERAGRKADPANWRVAKSIFVADDDKTAKAYATGGEQSLSLLLQPALHQDEAWRPLGIVQKAARTGGQRSHAGDDLQGTRDLRHAGQSGGRAFSPFASRSGISGHCSMPARTGPTASSAAARWCCWPKKSCRR